MKRVFLFLLTNAAIVIVLSIVLNIIYSTTNIQQGSLNGLLVLAAIFGFGGSFISLLLSKWMAKRSVGGKVIDSPSNETESWVFNTVKNLSAKSNIKMPEVLIYPSDDMNAFATGAKKNDSLVAVSTGLLTRMTRNEAEAVLAHEIAHVKNGDMVTMTLLQGVINTFVIFLSRIVASLVSNIGNNNSNNSSSGSNPFAYFATVFIFELIFGFLATPLVMWFSRHREYHADAGSAELVGKENMISALEALKTSHETELEGELTAFGIIGKKSLSELFMSHPPLDKRIEALRNGTYTNNQSKLIS